jgi:serine phosphatase RsbU (regulator of sigma subunit)
MRYRIPLLLLLFPLLSGSILGQMNPYGQPEIQNYHFAETGGGEQNWAITMDHRGLVYVGNQDQGILEYDGSDWRSIPVPENLTVWSLVTGDDGVIYAGLDGDFGRLEPDPQGRLYYRSLLDSVTRINYPVASIYKTYYQDGKVYYCGTEYIFVFDPQEQGLSVITLPEYAFFSYIVNSQLYTGDSSSGLMRYDGEGFVDVPGGSFFREKNVSGLVAMDPNLLLVGTYSSGLVLLDPETGNIDSSFVDPALTTRLKSGVLVSMLQHGNHIYLGTRDIGIVVLNMDGKVEENISAAEGLLDNTIPQIYVDSNRGMEHSLWVAHWRGVSRVECNSPFRRISIGPRAMGMGGVGPGEMITDVIEFRGDLVVSTLRGIHFGPNDPERPRSRSLRGIRGEIYDLEVIQPVEGKSYLIASGTERTYIIDEDLQVRDLPVGGQDVLVDPERPDMFFTGLFQFTGFRYRNGDWNEILKVDVDDRISKMSPDRGGRIWISTRTGLIRLDMARGQEAELTRFGRDEGLPAGNFPKVFKDPGNQELLVGTSEGFYRYDPLNNRFVPDSVFNSILPEGKNNIMAFQKGAGDMYWFSYDNEYRGWGMLGARRSVSGFEPVYDRVFRALSSRSPTDVIYIDSQDQLWFAKSNQLFHFDESRVPETMDSMKVLIRQVSITGDSVIFYGSNYRMDASGHIQLHDEQAQQDQPDLKHTFRDVEFGWSAPYYTQERQIRYSYYLDGFSGEWSEWSRARSVKINNLKHGRYVMKVKARNAYGDESPAAAFAFTILRPWYATVAAIFIYIILLASLVVFVILYTRNLKSRAELLEKQNREIEHQKKELENLNEEMTAQRDEIEAQRDSLSDQKELINKQNKAITDSIHYARRIQDAVLPADQVMRYLLPKHFVFYRPRDIVSGDFYWVDKRDETVLIAVADCTGHGVPGAFMSMLGISLLNEVSSTYGDRPTNEIMDEVRDQLIAALGQTGDKYEAKDGMDMALVAINTTNRTIQFTGANQHLYTFQDGELVVIKGDPMPVGIHAQSSTLFTAHSLQMKRGDTMYLFSDGYADQFGGEKRKKFGTAQLKTLLTDLQRNIMHDQKEALVKEFDKWKGQEEQIDDVLMIGIKL